LELGGKGEAATLFPLRDTRGEEGLGEEKGKRERRFPVPRGEWRQGKRRRKSADAGGEVKRTPGEDSPSREQGGGKG